MRPACPPAASSLQPDGAQDHAAAQRARQRQLDCPRRLLLHHRQGHRGGVWGAEEGEQAHPSSSKAKAMHGGLAMCWLVAHPWSCTLPGCLQPALRLGFSAAPR